MKTIKTFLLTAVNTTMNSTINPTSMKAAVITRLSAACYPAALFAVASFLTMAVPAAFSQTMYTVTGLGTLGGSSSFACGINNNGQVVGWSTTAGNSAIHAFLYSGGAMTDLGTLGGSSSEAYGINNNGQVVGWSMTTGGAQVAFLYSGGKMVDLNTLIPSGSGWTLVGAISINDNGQIVCRGCNASYQYEAFLLSPAPKPTTNSLAINMYAGLTFYGQIGNTYEIDYCNNLVASNWTTLATFVLSNNPCFYIDTSSTYFSQRFYRVVQQQIKLARLPLF